MGKRRHDNKGRSKGDGQYMTLPYAMVHHPAWRGLSSAAVKVFIELRSRFNGANNGKLSLSLEEGAGLLAMSKSTVARALIELERTGFIIKTKQGKWYGRQATEWRVTDQHYDGHPPSRDWQKLTVVGGKNKTRYPNETYRRRDGAA